MLLAADDSVPFVMALLIGGALIVAAIAVGVVTNRAISGDLGPNRGIGIRTKATRSSPQAWRQAHRAARPWMQFASMIALVTGVVVIPLFSSATAFYAVLAVGLVLFVVVLVFGAVAADRAARVVSNG